MNRDSRIQIAGDSTMIGQALGRVLRQRGYRNLVSTGGEYVFVAAGKSGGINANQKYPADFCADNLRVALDVLPASVGAKKLLYLGSSCIYPKAAPQPMSPASLGTGPLEPTSAAYASAKLAGIALCQAYRQQYGAKFITAIPADVYGPGGKFSDEDSHVIPSMLAKLHDAKQRRLDHVTLWGTGTPRREFTYADDLAEACLVAMEKYDGVDPINLGSGQLSSIRELAELARTTVGFAGELRWDTTRPDGAPVKSLETSVLRSLGWQPIVSLADGLRATYRSLCES